MNKKFIAGLCTAAIAVSAMSVSAFAADEATSFEATSDYVKTIGRTLYSNDTLWLNMSATGVEFTCTGSKVTFNLQNQGDKTRVGFFINGKLSAVKMTKSKCSVSLELPEGENTVKLVKLSEGPQSVLGIDEIIVEGENATIAPTAAKEHSIEFIGDSITCGYGVETALGKGSFSTANENAAKTYAYQTARAFDADYSFFSASGFGVISGYTSSEANTKQTMPQYYDKLGFSWSTAGTDNPQNIDWDFAGFSPEVIVVNLGTNDNSYTKGDAEKCAEYETAYVSFLKQIREKNPESKILCTLGIMGQELYPNIENAVAAYKAETSDENVYSFEFSNQDGNTNGYAVDYHPTLASHTFAANELEAEISELFGWETVSEDAQNDGTTEFVDSDELTVDEYVTAPDESSDSESSSEVVSDSEEESSSDSDSEDDIDSDASSDDVASTSDADSTSSKADSSTTTNPATGVAAGLSVTAVIGAAIIIVKKRK